MAGVSLPPATGLQDSTHNNEKENPNYQSRFHKKMQTSIYNLQVVCKCRLLRGSNEHNLTFEYKLYVFSIQCLMIFFSKTDNIDHQRQIENNPGQPDDSFADQP